MGQALRKLDIIYSGSSKSEGLELPEHSSKPSNNNNHNNDDYIYILERKLNYLKMYLDRNVDRKHILRSSGSSISEVKKFWSGSEVVDNLKTITVTEAHSMLGKSTKTIYKWCENGKLQARKVSGTTADYWQISYDSVMEVKNILEAKKLQTLEEVQEIDVPEVPIIEEIVPSSNMPIKIIDVGRNYIAEVDEKISLALFEQRKHFENMLTQQQELTISMFEELKKEKDRQIAESKAALDSLREDMERREGDIITRSITAWREEKEKERLSKRSWWRRLFKN